jgi:selenocysteine-specific elongation factor
VRRDQLVAAGSLVPNQPMPDGAVEVGGWLIHIDQWHRWQSELPPIAEAWAAERPLAPGLPRATAAQRLGLPDVAIVEPLVRTVSGFVLDGDGVHRSDTAATFPPEVEAALTDLERRLRARPFDAPEGPELATAGLTERFLAAAAKAGRLVAVTSGVYLLPDALDVAVARLVALPQPFTLSEARRALDTTRRVAVPLLELLDRRRVTVRVDASHRTVRDA